MAHYLSGVKPVGKDIGIGAYAKVFEVEFCGGSYAAKQIHVTLTESMKQEEFKRTKEVFIAECLQNRVLAHENLIRVLGLYDSGVKGALPVLVMELMQGNLTSVVEKYPNIPTKIKLSILLDVSRGLWYLHSHRPPIVHCGLSSNNVLLTSQFVAKLGDLAVTKVVQANRKMHVMMRPQGTIDFMAPEALQEIPLNDPPGDVFSCGGVILHAMNQEWPKPLHYIETDFKTGRLLGLSEVERRQQHIKKLAETDLQLFVKQCLDNQPTKRPLIADVAEKIKNMKETEDTKSPLVNMNPSTWQKTALSSFTINVKELNYKSDYVISADPKWSVSQVKEAMSAWHCKQTMIVFSGKELKDDMILEDAGIRSTTTIHCLHGNQAQKSSTVDVPLDKVNLSVDSVAAESQRTHFYVFCDRPCAAIAPGKLHVQCSECKNRSFVLFKTPSGWDDVLTPSHVHGRCSDCGGNTAKFYFKCENHKTRDDDLAIPLQMVRVNDSKVECITCMEIGEIITVFDCDVGHSMCLRCFVDYGEDALNNRRFILHNDHGYTIKCPAGCDGSEVKETGHFKILGSKNYGRYLRFAAEECLRKLGGIFCSAAGCGNGFLLEPGQRKVECNECRYVFCTRCKNEYHSGECITANERYVNENTKPCPHCKAPIEKNGGSSHMTCIMCKFEFCYCCLIEWNSNCQALHWFTASKSNVFTHYNKANEQYVRVNTKPCPHCSSPIEKNGGVNHMVCTLCKFEFCWLCLIQWNGDCQGSHWFY